MSIPQYSLGNTPFVGADGRLTFAGAKFLQQLWERVGGADAWSLDELMTTPLQSANAMDALTKVAEASQVAAELASLREQVSELSKTDLETQLNQLREQIAVFGGPAATYTPTAAIVLNLSAVTTGIAFYQRIGNVVRVSGSVTINVTTISLDTEFNLTLPIPSNLTASSRTTLFGTAISTGGRQATAVFNNGVTDRATFRFSAADTGTTILTYQYSYLCS